MPSFGIWHLTKPVCRGRSMKSAADDLLDTLRGQKFQTILADPPWQFQNRTGKMAPEHKRLSRYPTLSLEEICDMPVEALAGEPAHLYLWVPNAFFLPEGLKVMEHWGFSYKSNLVWYKGAQRWWARSARRGVSIFATSRKFCCFGVRGKNARTLPPGRSQENILVTQKREAQPQAGRTILT